MKKEEIVYANSLTGTIGEQTNTEEAKEAMEFAQEYTPIQQMWEVNPVDTDEYDGVIGYKEQ
ncbi:hypothetical protein [Litchfieldia salsa]|uniref:Uncharacterized protein n=1 Tax=Litchfieldia salsa TaxID=930152 RepID=A0A1H0WBP1_9BACI|nr:hypothetical protein [Litchfieldia salsa]SDP88087.1 hypothetical protein SAMN05216565_11069 [Litchfieldia salsa]